MENFYWLAIVIANASEAEIAAIGKELERALAISCQTPAPGS